MKKYQAANALMTSFLVSVLGWQFSGRHKEVAYPSASPAAAVESERVSGERALDDIQRKTLRYFWEGAHPASGMALERTNNLEAYGNENVVTTGGTGFGVMALITGVERGWIAREEAVAHIARIVDFLDRADSYNGVFPHFLDGQTGKTIPFSPKDNGGDLVETSFLITGLLCAREYFDSADPAESALRGRIQALWEHVDWAAHVKDGKLYWHRSPDHGFEMNLPITGWNEAFITYVLAAASPTHPVAPGIYEEEWTPSVRAAPDPSTPLFLWHYPFLAINPYQISDSRIGNYGAWVERQVQANYEYCQQVADAYNGYGPSCWGITASDGPDGYGAGHERGVTVPTAALASLPFAPRHSLAALDYFHSAPQAQGRYGLTDAFNPATGWTAHTELAINQGPVVIGIENARSGLFWDLGMNMPEIGKGLEKLGLTVAPRAHPALTFVQTVPGH